MAPAARYTRFVKFVRRFLWVLVATMMGIVIWIASDNSGENGARLVFSNIAQSGNLENVMLKPHYQGLDAHNQPFTVLADKAKQLDKDTVALTNINADMLRGGGNKDTWLALTAKDGMLNTKSKQMRLSGGVNVFYEGGYEFRTDHAQVDIQKGTAYGDARVEGQGPVGTLTAKRFEITEHGKTIRFNGSVRMKLYR